MENRKVLVVGAEENPALVIIESLAKKGLEVHAASHKKICVGLFSKYSEKKFLYPSPFNDEEGFINSLLEYIKKNKIDVTFATGEQPTYLLSRYKEIFKKHTRIPVVDFERYMKCRDKSVTMKIAQEVGIPTPRTYYPEEDDIESITEKISYPAVIKPNISNGARGISYPKNREELITLFSKTKEKYGPCHIQEYIPQKGMQFKAEILLDYTSDVKAGCVYSKPRYYPPTGGSSTLNFTVERKDILEYAAKILKEIGWYGMGDCDFIEDPRDNIPKLMEINPRFTRSIKICVMAGIDFPFLLYKLAMGEEVPVILNYKTGSYLRYLFGDIVWFIRSSERFKAKPSFFWFFGKNLRDEVISISDPGPALAYLLSKTFSLFNKNEREFLLR